MRALLLLAVLLPAIVFAVRSQFLSLLVYVWFTLAAPLTWVYTDLSALRLSLLLGLLVAIPREQLFLNRLDPAKSFVQNYGLPDYGHPLSVGTLLFLGTALVAQYWAPAPAIGWNWIDYLWKLLLVTLTAVSLINTERRLLWMMTVIGASVAMNSAKVGVGFLISGGAPSNIGLRGAFSDNNGFALLIVMALPMMVVAAQNTRFRSARWAWWAAVLTSALTVVSTFSRGGFLSMAAVIITFLSLQRRRMIGLSVFAGLVGLALLVVPMPKGYTERLTTIYTYEEVDETSAISRLHLWEVAVDMAQAYPFGLGLFNYPVAYDRFDTTFGQFGKSRAVHSSHFEVLAEQGYLGLATWIALFVLAFFFLFRARARSAISGRPVDSAHRLFTVSNALIASTVGFLVGGSFLAAALNELTWFTFAAVAALDRLSGLPVPVTGDAGVPTAGPAVPGPETAASPSSFQGGYRRADGSPEGRVRELS